jgi:hypothetical protein
MEAIRKWRFEPGRKDGIAVAVAVSIEVNFQLYCGPDYRGPIDPL